MIERIIELDQELFLYLNSLRNYYVDIAMYYITDRFFWVWFYALIIALIIWKFKKQALYVLPVLILGIVLADKFSSDFMKFYFERLRPCHDPGLRDFVLLGKECGGLYSFTSSHAANSFAFGTGFWLFLKPYFRYSWLIFIWAALVSYSRVYVGVHYPGDIIVGAMCGAIIAWLIYTIFRKIVLRMKPELVPQ